MSNLVIFWLPWTLAFALLAILALRWRRDRGRALRALAEMRQQAQRQQRAHEAVLRAARAEAEAAERAKTRFLAVASHDLRQPAHALGLYLAALRGGELAPEQAALAERLAASLDALDGMIAALLDVSRIDADAVVPQWGLVPLAPLLRRLADEYGPAAEARGLRVSLHLALPLEEAAATTVTDALLLERVLRNLLSNAVQNTRRGGLLLACRLRRGGDGEPRLRIEVWDSGVGIAPAAQERVFEEFQQLSRGEGGVGLGLAIARRLAQLLQLRLVLHSRPGRGSVFFIEGLVPAGPATLQAAAAQQQLRRLAGVRVVVLDDDETVRDATRRLLQRWDCEVCDGADAAAVLAQPGASAPAHAVLADLHLADGGLGLDEAQRLFNTWGHAVPLLLISGDTSGPQPPGVVVLAKPVSPARLRAWLEHALSNPSTA
jgi:signal transduction histidine kinase